MKYYVLCDFVGDDGDAMKNVCCDSADTYEQARKLAVHYAKKMLELFEGVGSLDLAKELGRDEVEATMADVEKTVVMRTQTCTYTFYVSTKKK